MVTIKTNEEAKSLIHNGVLAIDDDLTIEIDDFKIKADLKCYNLIAYNIDAWNINAGDIDAGNIDADNINARNINAWNINADNIDANNIDAYNIDADNIDANNIDAYNINYFAVCFAHKDITCNSIKGVHKNSKHFCLEGKIIIKN